MNSDPIDKIFKEVAEMTPQQKPDEDPYQSEEYQKFVASMVKHCQCRANNCPCDGVLAGGPCDMIQEEQPLGFDDED